MMHIIKYYYGDFGESGSGETTTNNKKNIAPASNTTGHDWPLWEVFIRSKQGLEHKHCGSLHAVDAKQALQTDRLRLLS